MKKRFKSKLRHKHADLSKTVSIKREGDLVDIVEQTTSPFFLILDNVQDPHNLGACLRTADAAGAHAVIVPKDRSVTLTQTVRRIASGAAEHLPFVQVTNLARTLRYLKDNRIRVVGTADDAEQSLYELDLDGPLAIVLGAEGEGMRRLTRETCDYLVRIPMAGTVECLNVSVAAGVCLFEAVRQRQAGHAQVKRQRGLSLKPTTKSRG